ncbi:MAG: hypothetical protein QNJ19_00170 [Woeseiaceae bacterium]|nr:hypothetical protein [Woeseiaceae bacterium]
MLARILAAASCGVVLCCLANPALAEGTPAGTVIENTATLSFELDGNPATITSNTTSITVVELIDLAVTLQSPQTLVSAGDTNQALLFSVVNTGNGTETFQLAINSTVSGDDFDPVPSTVSIYFDSDGSGDFTAGDIPYVPGDNDPVLAPDASVAILILNDIPADRLNGDVGFSELIVSSATGSGSPGDDFAGQGDGGVTAVLGTSGGIDTVRGEYLVSDVQVSIQKSQTVSDPFGGNEPVPGATITYTIEVSVTGSGTAVGGIVEDVIPTFTTYVPGSLTLDAGTLTDAADADAGELNTSTTPTIVVRLGDVTATGSPRTVQFDVLID